MKKPYTFRPQGLDGLEVRLAPSSMNLGAFLAQHVAHYVGSIDAEVHDGGHHGGHHSGHGGGSRDGESRKK